MSLSIEYVNNEAGVVITYPREITGQAVIDSLQKVYKDPRFTGLMFFLSDRTNLEKADISQAEVREIALLRKQYRSRNPDLYLVLVSPSDLMQGLSRMFVAQAEANEDTTKLCRSREEAEALIADHLS